jgi:hypothetical protein
VHLDSQAGRPLRIVTGADHAPASSRIEVAASEEDVLARAIADMGSWIRSLPDASEWRWSFLRSQRVLVGELAELRSLARNAGQV